jgi:alpha-ketoglutarate-dependent taurine dioxygenase
MANVFKVESLDATFGAFLAGLKFGELDDARWQDLYAARLEYARLVFPGQHLGRDEPMNFARHLGKLEFDLAAISTVKKDGSILLETDDSDIMRVLKGNMGRHCDRT